MKREDLIISIENYVRYDFLEIVLMTAYRCMNLQDTFLIHSIERHLYKCVHGKYPIRMSVRWRLYTIS